MQQSGSRSNLPRTVRTAVLLLYLALAIGLISSAVQAPQVFQQMTGQAGDMGEYGAMAAKVMVYVAVAVGLGIFLLMFFVAYMISQRRNWARIVFTVLFAISIPFTLWGMAQLFAAAQLMGLIGLIQFGMQVAALILLYQRPSSDWFAGRAPSA